MERKRNQRRYKVVATAFVHVYFDGPWMLNTPPSNVGSPDGKRGFPRIFTKGEAMTIEIPSRTQVQLSLTREFHVQATSAREAESTIALQTIKPVDFGLRTWDELCLISVEPDREKATTSHSNSPISS
jgi:hypothetical protein